MHPFNPWGTMAHIRAGRTLLRPTPAPAAARRRRDAEQRGLRLLWENITPEQREQLKTLGYMICVGNCHGDTYYIYPRIQQNILCIPKPRGKKLGGWPDAWGLCIVPDGNLVLGDVMLSQKLAIELEEKSVRRQANYLFPDIAYLTRFAEEKRPLWGTL